MTGMSKFDPAIVTIDIISSDSMTTAEAFATVFITS